MIRIRIFLKEDGTRSYIVEGREGRKYALAQADKVVKEDRKATVAALISQIEAEIGPVQPA